ncbi:hypothetical protein AAC387_Pa03g2396 [Persea americana]
MLLENTTNLELQLAAQLTNATDEGKLMMIPGFAGGGFHVPFRRLWGKEAFFSTELLSLIRFSTTKDVILGCGLLLDSVLQAIYIAVNDFLQKRERESFRKKRVPRRKSVQRKPLCLPVSRFFLQFNVLDM